MPVRYDKKNLKIQHEENIYNTDEPTKKIVGWTNEVTRKFQQDGYVILRNFIPKEIINMTMDTWLTIEHDQRLNDAFFIREHDIIHNSPESSLEKSQGCHTFPPAVALHRWLRDNLRNVLDMQLQETYAYSRKYDRGAFLKAHSDRPSCEVSATICLKYKSDDNTPWKIWVQRDKNYITRENNNQDRFYEEMQNVPHHARKGVPVSLEVGDVLLYQGPNAVHWRDTFLGDYSYHMFLHFVNTSGTILNFDGFTRKLTHCVKDITAHKGAKDQWHIPAADDRPLSVFTYDGRESRYHPNLEQSQEFMEAMQFWNEWNQGMHNEFTPELFINHYDYIEDVELTEREKKRIEDDSI